MSRLHPSRLTSLLILSAFVLFTLLSLSCIGAESETYATHENTLAQCSDGQDNDGDGDFDCYDMECIFKENDNGTRTFRQDANGNRFCPLVDSAFIEAMIRQNQYSSSTGSSSNSKNSSGTSSSSINNSTSSSSATSVGFPITVKEGNVTKAHAIELATSGRLILVGDKQDESALFANVTSAGAISIQTVNRINIDSINNADSVVFLSASNYSGGILVTGYMEEAGTYMGIFSTVDDNGSFSGTIWTTSPNWGYPEYQAVDGDITPGDLACIVANGIDGSSVDGLIIRLKPLADLKASEDPELKMTVQSNTTYTSVIAQSDDGCIAAGWQDLGGGQFAYALLRMTTGGGTAWSKSYSPGDVGATSDIRLVDIAMNTSNAAALAQKDANMVIEIIDPSDGSITSSSNGVAGTAVFIEVAGDGDYFIGGSTASRAVVLKVAASDLSVTWSTQLAGTGSIAVDLAEGSDGTLYVTGTTENSGDYESWVRVLDAAGVEQ